MNSNYKFIMKIAGFLLITLGLLMLLVPGIVVPVKKHVITVGPVEINKTQDEWLGWPGYTGIVLTIGGVVLVLLSRKKV